MIEIVAGVRLHSLALAPLDGLAQRKCAPLALEPPPHRSHAFARRAIVPLFDLPAILAEHLPHAMAIRLVGGSLLARPVVAKGVRIFRL